jgi:hypothetical protein
LHAAPAPQAQLPSTPQLSPEGMPQVTHAAPALPHAAMEGAVHTAPAQQPAGQEAAVQAPAPSTRQSSEHPSPETVLPSSHSSIGSRRMPSPQIAGGPRVKVAFTSCPRCTATASWSLPTTVSPARPSTRKRTVVPASASGSNRTAVSRPPVSGRGGSGTVPGGKAG